MNLSHLTEMAALTFKISMRLITHCWSVYLSWILLPVVIPSLIHILSSSFHLFKFLLKFILGSSENSSYTAEVTSFQIDKDLPILSVGDRLDVWWNFVFKSQKYSVLSKVVKSLYLFLLELQLRPHLAC